MHVEYTSEVISDTDIIIEQIEIIIIITIITTIIIIIAQPSRY